MADDPRVDILTKAAIEAMGDYDSHFAGAAERARMETVLFLARYDALCAAYQIHPEIFVKQTQGLANK